MLGISVAVAIASIVPGARQLDFGWIAGVIGAALLMLSYLIDRRPFLLLARIMQSLLFAVLFGLLVIIKIDSPLDPIGWMAISGLSVFGFTLSQLAPSIRSAVEREESSRGDSPARLS